MKHIKLGILFFMFVETVFAQTKGDSIQRGNQSYIAITGGLNVPLGNFALTDIKNNGAGFAKKGFTAGILFTRVLWKRMGVAAMYRFQNNTIDTASLVKGMISQYPNFGWSVITTPWKINVLMAGYYSSHPLDRAKKIYFDIKLLLGGVRTYSSSYTYTGTIGTNLLNVSQPVSVANSFGYCLGLGFKFNVTDDIYILLHADYLQSKPEFKNVPITNSVSGIVANFVSSSITTQNFEQKISAFNLNLGIAVKID